MQLQRSKISSATGVQLLFSALLLVALCGTWSASAASVQVARSHLDAQLISEQLSPRSPANAAAFPSAIPKRHGDHEDEDEQDEQDANDGHVHGNDMAHEMTMPTQNTENAEHHQHADGDDHENMHQAAHMDSSHQHDHEHSHGHGHSHHNVQATGPSPASIPDAAVAGTELRDLPVWHAHKGHSHSHGSGPILEQLNETLLFRAHGPDPLSYVEWDFGYGLGSVAELRRFTTNADVLAGRPKMGVVDGRWRKFLDESEPEQRQAIAADIASRLPEGQGQEPSRHRGLLVFHVVTAVLSCFVLLPMALVLRAAHSTLAPFVSLLYLTLLGGSMFLSIVYKALTPRLYPDNAHGSMGWAILWISLATLGSDVFRLIGQIWSAVSASRSQKQSGSSAWLPTNSAEDNSGRHRSWKDVIGTMLGRHQRHAQNSETYDALEEEAMLSEEAQSDAQELDLEKHMCHRFSSRRSPGSSRAGSGSGSPHRVHFDEHASSADHGASAEPLVEPVNWVGSGSTAVSSPRQREQHMENTMVASPTTTACNTPRNSIFGSDSTLLPPLNRKTIALWNKQTHEGHVASLQDAPMGDMTLPTKNRSGRLDTVRTIVRYTRVVAARSLPILAFATSYTGLAVYTGSCRRGYKNVCLAHSIKGGIFFWFGLLTFGRYLGAYADCGWAWNKRPSAQASNGKRALAAWRRSMPSAEFVECLVIFIYGASNTWMERFGAAPGDPYTIKQIQHISIAVMFWFAGLMGMLLETKTIRNMLSFPIAYHHVAAVPLREARRRRHGRNSHQQSRHGQGEAAADADLDMLVDAQTQPASYSASFNPFPALVIGVTGVAMAAHHQDYQYEVEIHMLWGQLLAGFALLRCLTYFLLWLRPPTASVLPSRPPTEALAAFSLCCGGLVFMLSSEEVSFAAMRSGYGDFMAILNAAVAVMALLFCWTTALMMLKGWAVRREVRRTVVETEGCSSNALRLDVPRSANEQEERVRRQMRASVVSGNLETAEAAPVFVLDEDDEDDDAPPNQAARK
ncbi:uncharacterized protein SPSC_04856 [Sporisorium scitamineum]|uniref:Integral membrane protein n=1 Tax=Sporisorium scitamineum TaxID=49012 RepID=A0A0F7RX01_9BASI|nr:hypothetical protein [Sporisorium scitamineum]CDU25022.1 uncharacterized protein SPSC_04856 [Sporisorium scitamineum]